MKYLLITLLSFYLFSQCTFANTDVQLSINSSNVGNIYYQIFGNNQPIYDELEFSLKNEQGVEYKIRSKDSILFLKNIPFGEYELTIKNKPFTHQIKIDKQYLKTQHLLKRMDIYNQPTTPETGDSMNIGLYITLLGVTSLFMFLIIYK